MTIRSCEFLEAGIWRRSSSMVGCDAPPELGFGLMTSVEARTAAAAVHRVRIVAVFGGIMAAGLLSPTLFGLLGTAIAMTAAGAASTLATVAVWRRMPPERLAAD